MPRTLVTVSGLANEENRLLAENIARFPSAYRFANDTISLISGGVTGFVESRKAFGFYYAEITTTLTLAMISALRQHHVQAHANLRHSLEHTSAALYALAHPEEDKFFSADPDKPINPKALSEKGYNWLKVAHPDISADIKKYKDFINDRDAHANILHAERNTASTIGGLEVNFFDHTDPVTIQADLIHVGMVGLISLLSIGAVNQDFSVVRGKTGLKAEAHALIQLGEKLKQDIGGQTI